MSGIEIWVLRAENLFKVSKDFNNVAPTGLFREGRLPFSTIIPPLTGLAESPVGAE